MDFCLYVVECVGLEVVFELVFLGEGVCGEYFCGVVVD